jgi:hypothetical protein
MNILGRTDRRSEEHDLDMVCGGYREDEYESQKTGNKKTVSDGKQT